MISEILKRGAFAFFLWVWGFQGGAFSNPVLVGAHAQTTMEEGDSARVEAAAALHVDETVQPLLAASATTPAKEAEPALQFFGYFKTADLKVFSSQMLEAGLQIYPQGSFLLPLVLPMLAPLGYPDFENVVHGQDTVLLLFKDQAQEVLPILAVKLNPSVAPIFIKGLPEVGLAHYNFPSLSPLPSEPQESEPLSAETVPWTLIAGNPEVFARIPDYASLKPYLESPRQTDLQLRILSKAILLSPEESLEYAETLGRLCLKDPSQGHLKVFKAYFSVFHEEICSIESWGIGVNLGKQNLELRMEMRAQPSAPLHSLFSQQTPKGDIIGLDYLNPDASCFLFFSESADPKALGAYCDHVFASLKKQPEIPAGQWQPWKNVLENWLSQWGGARVSSLGVEEQVPGIHYQELMSGRFTEVGLGQLCNNWYGQLIPQGLGLFDWPTPLDTLAVSVKPPKEPADSLITHIQFTPTTEQKRASSPAEEAEAGPATPSSSKGASENLYVATQKGWAVLSNRLSVLERTLQAIQAGESKRPKWAERIPAAPNALWHLWVDLKQALLAFLKEAQRTPTLGISSWGSQTFAQSLEGVNLTPLNVTAGCDQGALVLKTTLEYKEMMELSRVFSEIFSSPGGEESAVQSESWISVEPSALMDAEEDLGGGIAVLPVPSPEEFQGEASQKEKVAL